MTTVIVSASQPVDKAVRGKIPITFSESHPLFDCFAGQACKMVRSEEFCDADLKSFSFPPPELQSDYRYERAVRNSYYDDGDYISCVKLKECQPGSTVLELVNLCSKEVEFFAADDGSPQNPSSALTASCPVKSALLFKCSRSGEIYQYALFPEKVTDFYFYGGTILVSTGERYYQGKSLAYDKDENVFLPVFEGEETWHLARVDKITFPPTLIYLTSDGLFRGKPEFYLLVKDGRRSVFVDAEAETLFSAYPHMCMNYKMDFLLDGCGNIWVWNSAESHVGISDLLDVEVYNPDLTLRVEEEFYMGGPNGQQFHFKSLTVTPEGSVLAKDSAGKYFVLDVYEV